MNKIIRKSRIKYLDAEETIKLLKKLSTIKKLMPDFIKLSEKLSFHLARLFESTFSPIKDEKMREEIAKTRRQIEDYLKFVGREDKKEDQTLTEVK